MSKLYLFTTTTCPKCPMAKKFIKDNGISCILLEADTSPTAMKLAQDWGIMTVPAFVKEHEDGKVEIVNMKDLI